MLFNSERIAMPPNCHLRQTSWETHLSKHHGFFYFFYYYFIIHMCLQGLGHFSSLPPTPPLPPTSPPPSPPPPPQYPAEHHGFFKPEETQLIKPWSFVGSFVCRKSFRACTHTSVEYRLKHGLLRLLSGLGEIMDAKWGNPFRSLPLHPQPKCAQLNGAYVRFHVISPRSTNETFLGTCKDASRA
jgi:hypothetical protein